MGAIASTTSGNDNAAPVQDDAPSTQDTAPSTQDTASPSGDPAPLDLEGLSKDQP